MRPPSGIHIQHPGVSAHCTPRHGFLVCALMMTSTTADGDLLFVCFNLEEQQQRLIDGAQHNTGRNIIHETKHQHTGTCFIVIFQISGKQIKIFDKPESMMKKSQLTFKYFN